MSSEEMRKLRLHKNPDSWLFVQASVLIMYSLPNNTYTTDYLLGVSAFVEYHKNTSARAT